MEGQDWRPRDDGSDQERVEDELRLLRALALAIGAAEDLTSALSVVLRGVCEAMGWTSGQVWIPDARGTAWFLSVILLVLHRLLHCARGVIRLCQVDERRQFAAEIAFLHARGSPPGAAIGAHPACVRRPSRMCSATSSHART